MSDGCNVLEKLRTDSLILVAELITLQIRRPGTDRVYLYPQLFSGISYLLAAIFMLELSRSMRRSKQRLAAVSSDDEQQ